MDLSIQKWIHTLCPECLDPNWIKAIIIQESQGNPDCVRYEPSYRWLYKVEEFAKHPLISYQTEIATQRMSWGLGQIMGALAREQGHQGLMGELLRPEINIRHICQRVAYLHSISHSVEDIFATYNGGPGAIHKVNGRYRNEKYVQSVMAHLQKYKA